MPVRFDQVRRFGADFSQTSPKEAVTPGQFLSLGTARALPWRGRLHLVLCNVLRRELQYVVPGEF